MSVAANIGDILVKEMVYGTKDAPLHLVSTPADIDILDFKFVQVIESFSVAKVVYKKSLLKRIVKQKRCPFAIVASLKESMIHGSFQPSGYWSSALTRMKWYSTMYHGRILRKSNISC